MTVVILAIIVTFALTFLGCYVFFTTKYERELREQRLAYQEKIRHIIDYLNHQGEIPIASTAAGLIAIISWGLSRVLEELSTLLVKREWNTEEVITKLREIVQQEFALLAQKVNQWLGDQRGKLNDIYEENENL